MKKNVSIGKRAANPSLADEIATGLGNAIAFATGRRRRARVHLVEIGPASIKSMRRTLGFSQASFAQALNVSVGTLRNWEQGRRAPVGPARTLLRVFSREPAAVVRALTR